MTQQHSQANPHPDQAAGLRTALAAADPSARLQAALTAGTRPDPAFIEPLLARCATESDFYVRDMLTWALIQHDHAEVLARLFPELNSPIAQARSQALHTLSKIGDPASWPAIRVDHLRDVDDEVARAAWRAAAGLVPAADAAALAAELARQFGRGDRDVQLSLSRAFAVLGPAGDAAVERAQHGGNAEARVHAVATERIMQDPEEGFEAALFEARRAVALRSAPLTEG